MVASHPPPRTTHSFSVLSLDSVQLRLSFWTMLRLTSPKASYFPSYGEYSSAKQWGSFCLPKS